ncbi:unnamed protein product [Ectocarpus sp. CCAP 1310/34]|nr:unnamed protein product [Ectocarpus sp. CCAP 1310/34]
MHSPRRLDSSSTALLPALRCGVLGILALPALSHGGRLAVGGTLGTTALRRPRTANLLSSWDAFSSSTRQLVDGASPGVALRGPWDPGASRA